MFDTSSKLVAEQRANFKDINGLETHIDRSEFSCCDSLMRPLAMPRVLSAAERLPPLRSCLQIQTAPKPAVRAWHSRSQHRSRSLMVCSGSIPSYGAAHVQCFLH